MTRTPIALFAALGTLALTFAPSAHAFTQTAGHEGGNGAPAARAVVEADVEAEPETRVVYAKKSEITFSDVDVNGKAVGPDGTRVWARKKVGFSPLIDPPKFTNLADTI